MSQVKQQRIAALINATIHEMAAAGCQDITMAQIAKRAGVSAPLAHHYFGSKDQLLFEAMRQILRDFGDEVTRSLAPLTKPMERLKAIISAALGGAQFQREIIAAWMNFHVLSLNAPQFDKLLKIYHKRLHSNLVHECKQLVPHHKAAATAFAIAALIDGVYIRLGHGTNAVSAAGGIDMIYVTAEALINASLSDGAKASQFQHKEFA